MKRHIKKSVKALIWTLVVLLIIFAVFTTIFCVGSNSNTNYICANFGAIEREDPATYIFDETTNRYEFQMPADRNLKILQLTDAHIGGGIFCEGLDKKAFNAIYKIIKGTLPDLVIFTGDVIYPLSIQSGNINNIKTAKQFTAFMEKLAVPWTLIFGNHDNSPVSFASRSDLADYYASPSLKHCLFTKNPKDASVYGYGNQIINVRNADGTLNNSLVLFDSNSNYKGDLTKYDIIHDDQVKWYENSIRTLSTDENGFTDGDTVPSLVFTHIPINEYQDAWDAYKAGKPEAQYLWGVKDEKILAPVKGGKYPTSKLFAAMLDLGSTKAVFCGHNHRNNFAIIYQGIQLTFSKSIVYLGFHNIANTDAYRGGTLIEIAQDRSFTSKPVGINEV